MSSTLCLSTSSEKSCNENDPKPANSQKKSQKHVKIEQKETKITKVRHERDSGRTIRQSAGSDLLLIECVGPERTCSSVPSSFPSVLPLNTCGLNHKIQRRAWLPAQR